MIGEFPVTYSYSIAGDETDRPTNPILEMLPSLNVKITARPVKPTVNYGCKGIHRRKRLPTKLSTLRPVKTGVR